jgi:tetratricopeptide (TPR) repeat protein
MGELGSALNFHRQYAEALPVLQDARHLAVENKVQQPPWLSPFLNRNLAEAEWATGRLSEAEHSFRQALTGYGSLPQERSTRELIRQLLAGVLFDEGKQIEAAALFEDALKQPLSDRNSKTLETRAVDHHALALLRSSSGDTNGYRQAALRMQQDSSLTNLPVIRAYRARVWAMDPAKPGEDLSRAVAQAEGLVKQFPRYHYARQTLALCLLRTGKPAEAAVQLQAMATMIEGKDNSFDDLLRALAAHQTEPTEKTTEALKAAVRKTEALLELSPEGGPFRLKQGWVTLLEMRLVCRQATELLAGKKS